MEKGFLVGNSHALANQENMRQTYSVFKEIRYNIPILIKKKVTLNALIIYISS